MISKAVRVMSMVLGSLGKGPPSPRYRRRVRVRPGWTGLRGSGRTASATLRQVAMSWANVAGVIVCEPSETACSGSSWTSMIRPSAPAAMAAFDIGATSFAFPVPCEGSTTTGRVALVLEVGDGRQRQGEPGVVLIGPDTPLAEHDVGVVAVEDVLGGEEEFVDRRAHASLEQGRLARVANGLEELIILHVPGADLEDVGVLRATIGTCSGAMTSVTIARPVSSRAVASILRPSSLWPWKL